MNIRELHENYILQKKKVLLDGSKLKGFAPDK